VADDIDADGNSGEESDEDEQTPARTEAVFTDEDRAES
jgi:hypothetical protein